MNNHMYEGVYGQAHSRNELFVKTTLCFPFEPKPMRDLFRRSSALFWQYPSLWLPVAIADLASFCFTQTQIWLVHTVIASFAKGSSVLSDAPDPADISRLTVKIALLTRPIVWCDHMLSLCLYTAAMIAISIRVQQVITGGDSFLSRIISALKQSGVRLIIFAFKILLCIGVATIPLALFAGFISRGSLRLPFYGPVMVPIYYAGFAFGLLLSAAIAYLLAPAAVSLLRQTDAGSISSETVRLARIASVLTLVVSDALYLLAVNIGHSFISATSSAVRIYAIEALQSMVSGAPYILLFIALSLLASTENAVIAFTGEFGGEDTSLEVAEPHSE